MRKVEVPLKRVVLFNSGVGFFEHQSEIEGDGQVELKFNTEDVNDLLKSMVLDDLGGGRVSSVTYASKDPIDKTLRTFAIDLTTNPTLADLLRQVRGEVVEVEAPDKIVGSIVGVETRRTQVGREDVIETDHLILLTEGGLRSIAMTDVGRIRLANESLDKDLRQALAVLASAHAMDKKTVTLEFLGEGKRPVSVGYILDAPIWKTSYRLVLGEKGKARLQGWAIVENTTEEDWNDVDLLLVSGRPISFVMNLYDPLYISRPVVEPELFASLRPQTYGQDLADKEKQFAEVMRRGRTGAPARPRAEAEASDGANLAMSPVEDAAGGGFGGGGHRPGGSPATDYGRGVQSAAQGGNLGELFQYRIEAPVSLARQRSAMLPIVNATVDAKKVSIYNPGVHAKHPLNGLQLKNTTELHLMQGPITVFDDGAYAGDARIEDLSPGGERLVSYAMDLGVEIAPSSKPHPEQLTSVSIIKGVMHAARKYRRETKYTIKNSNEETRDILIEYPIESKWTLVTPEKPAEKTRDQYRFAVEAKPGKAVQFVVAEEMVQKQQVAVSKIDDGSIQFFLSAPVVSEAVKKALQEVVAQKQQISAAQGLLRTIEQKIAGIAAEQDRIRQNMTTLDRNSDLYRRYVKKFGDQEDEIEALRKQFAEMTEQLRNLQNALNTYLATLNIGVDG